MEHDEQVLVAALQVAEAAVGMKSLAVRNVVRRKVMGKVHTILTAETERNMQRALEPFFREQIGDMASRLGSGKSFQRTKSLDGPPILEVPNIRQPDHYSCGACAAMSVGRFFGVGSEDLGEWKSLLGTTLERSTDPRMIVGVLSDLDLEVEERHGMTVDDLAEATRNGRPVICPVQDYMSKREPGAEFDYGHYLVVIGVVDGHVVCQDSSIDNVQGRPGGGVSESDEEESQNIAAPGRILVRVEDWEANWHDVGEDGTKYVRYGIIVGRRGYNHGSSDHIGAAGEADAGPASGGSQHRAHGQPALLGEGGLLARVWGEEAGGDVREGGGRGAGACKAGDRPGGVPRQAADPGTGQGGPDPGQSEGADDSGLGGGGCRCGSLRCLGEGGIGCRGLRDHEHLQADPERDGGSRGLAPGAVEDRGGAGRRIVPGSLGGLKAKTEAQRVVGRIFSPKRWRSKLVDRLLPVMALGMAKAVAAEYKVLGIDIRRRRKQAKEVATGIYAKASRASTWLEENPEDLEELDEMIRATGLPGTNLFTEMPKAMKQRVVRNLNESFKQDYWDNISETTGGNAETILEEGLQNGWSMQEIASKLREELGGDDYARTRSRNIARTEAGNALNGARKEEMESLRADVGDKVPMRSTWVSVLGTTTRAEHADLDGVPADDDGLWDLGGYMIPWPGHISLPPDMRCNCQCTVVMEFGVDDDSARSQIDDYIDRQEAGLEEEEE